MCKLLYEERVLALSRDVVFAELKGGSLKDVLREALLFLGRIFLRSDYLLQLNDLLLEDLELGLRDSDPLVADGNAQDVELLLLDADLDLPSLRELYRVGEQVHQHLLNYLWL